MKSSAQRNREARRNARGQFAATTGLDRALNRVRVHVTLAPAMRIALESLAAENGLTLTRQIERMLAREIDQTMVAEQRN